MTREEIIKTNQIYPEYEYKPDLPWINIKNDLPCNHSEMIYGTEVSDGTETIDVFCSNQYGHVWTDYMIYENGKWRWNDFVQDFWMLPPKLPR